MTPDTDSERQKPLDFSDLRRQQLQAKKRAGKNRFICGYILSTVLIVAFGGFWIGIFAALLIHSGKVDLIIALQHSAWVILVLLIASLRFHRIIRKICFPFACISWTSCGSLWPGWRA